MAQEPILKSKKVWAGAYGLVVAFAFMAQLALGAKLGIVILLAALSALAVLPLSGSMVTVGDGVFLVFLLYSAPLALILKSFVGQAVNTNLNDPDQSAVYLTIGTASATFGYLVVRRRFRMFNATQSLAGRFRNVNFLSRVSMPAFLIGTLAVALQAILLRRSDSAGGSEGFGGFGALAFLVQLGTVCQICATIMRPKSSEKIKLTIIVLITALLAVISNTKIVALLLAQVATVAYFTIDRFRLRLSLLISGLFAAFILLAYVSPAIHIVRDQTSTISGLERVSQTFKVISEAGFDPSILYEEEDRTAGNHSYSFRQSYLYPSTLPVDRFAMIKPVDEVSSELGSTPVMHLGPIFNDIKEAIPGPLTSKSGVSSPDLIGWYFGFRPNGVIGRPVVGLVASSAASFGLFGILVLPGLIMALSTMLLDKLGGHLHNNPLAIFLLTATATLAEKEVGQFGVQYLRVIPLIFVVLFALPYFFERGAKRE